MIDTVIAYLDKTNSVWSNVPAFATAVTDLKAAVSSIGTEAGRQQSPTVGATANKAHARDLLEDAVVELADQLAAFGEASGKPDLPAIVDLNRSDLDRLIDAELLATAKRVSELATENLAGLADYLVTAAEVTHLTSLADSFGKLKTAPREAVVQRSSATVALPEQIAAATRILRRRIDKLMTRFRKLNPDFFAGYRVARVVVDRGGHKHTDATLPADPPAADPGASPA